MVCRLEFIKKALVVWDGAEMLTVTLSPGRKACLGKGERILTWLSLDTLNAGNSIESALG